ncbi:DUF3459 domain-containing protein, partial [Stutzerimonas nitrititolerans]|uniref:DUF3459 domain-containing protein n=1 Tax=Stutzerimonas nitrititolerans TaxID=2482751 RepID=UPI0028AE660D
VGAANSTFDLYRRLIAARKASPALTHGSWEELRSHPEVLAYRRRHGADERIVCINFADKPHVCPINGHWRRTRGRPGPHSLSTGSLTCAPSGTATP